ncbi:hypothetical protein [Streptomyces sp. NPDC050759]|uniref:hypothetical protein n=1 Tax=Streptomyces sp. NPDC050759 TaxID=3365635 RepID=UPI003788C7D3
MHPKMPIDPKCIGGTLTSIRAVRRRIGPDNRSNLLERDTSPPWCPVPGPCCAAWAKWAAPPRTKKTSAQACDDLSQSGTEGDDICLLLRGLATMHPMQRSRTRRAVITYPVLQVTTVALALWLSRQFEVARCPPR